MFSRTIHETRESHQDPYAEPRELMIEEQLRRRGVVLHSVLEAMHAIPRHLFVAHEHSSRAYADEALPSNEGQTISQPYMVGLMTQELAVCPGLRILEIGTGTGYQTALLAYLLTPGTTVAPAVGDSPASTHGTVFTVERVASHAESARRRLDALDIHNVRLHVGDGSAGWPQNDPEWDGPRSPGGDPLFDRILLTAGAPDVPAPLLAQLADGGILLAPIGNSDSQMLTRIVRHGQNLAKTEILSCRFVPLLGAHGWQN